MSTQLPSRTSPAAAFFWSTLERLPGTVSVWALFGIVTGIRLTPPDKGGLAVVAMIIAGLIVFVPLGIMLAVIGARWKGSLYGGAAGMCLAFAIAVLTRRPDAAYLAAFGLIFGGMMGGTFLNVAYRLPRLIFGQLRKLINPPPAKPAVLA